MNHAQKKKKNTLCFTSRFEFAADMNLICFLPDRTRIWTWTLKSSCSCTPGTLGPTWFSASLGDSWLTGFLASGKFIHQKWKWKSLSSFIIYLFFDCIIGWELSSSPSLSVLDRWVYFEYYMWMCRFFCFSLSYFNFFPFGTGDICHRSLVE